MVLRYPPGNVNLFRTDLQHMGITALMEKIISVKPQEGTLEAIQRLKSSTTVMGCKSFAGIVNYLSTSVQICKHC